MRADRFEDLIALVALYRQGPMENIPTYCARKLGQERSEERRVGKECRSLCDWSSDVCSSDLHAGRPVRRPHRAGRALPPGPDGEYSDLLRPQARTGEIGRASCRERV